MFLRTCNVFLFARSTRKFLRCISSDSIQSNILNRKKASIIQRTDWLSQEKYHHRYVSGTSERQQWVDKLNVINADIEAAKKKSWMLLAPVRHVSTDVHGCTYTLTHEISALSKSCSTNMLSISGVLGGSVILWFAGLFAVILVTPFFVGFLFSQLVNWSVEIDKKRCLINHFKVFLDCRRYNKEFPDYLPQHMDAMVEYCGNK